MIVVEASAALGGTATRGGVSNWESGVGGTGIPFDLFRRVKHDFPSAVGICSFGRHFCWQDQFYWPHALDKVNFPGGELLIDPSLDYADTLRRHSGPGEPKTEASSRARLHSVSCLPETIEQVQQAMLDETGNVTTLLNTSFVGANARDGRVERAILDDGAELRSDLWLDCAGGELCRALDCQTLCGIDPRARFNEAGAPDEASDEVNGVSLVYRIMPGHPESIEPLPSGVPAECWWTTIFPAMHCVQGPDMGRSCNMLPTMQGREFMALGYGSAESVGRKWYRREREWGVEHGKTGESLAKDGQDYSATGCFGSQRTVKRVG